MFTSSWTVTIRVSEEELDLPVTFFIDYFFISLVRSSGLHVTFL